MLIAFITPNSKIKARKQKKWYYGFSGQLTFTFQYSHMIDGLAPEIETSSNYQQDPNMLIAHSPRELIIEQTEWVIENSDDTV